MNTKLLEIRELIDGYIDGAPDASSVSKLANQIAVVIDGPASPPKPTQGAPWIVHSATPDATFRVDVCEEQHSITVSILTLAPKIPTQGAEKGERCPSCLGTGRISIDQEKDLIETCEKCGGVGSINLTEADKQLLEAKAIALDFRDKMTYYKNSFTRMCELHQEAKQCVTDFIKRENELEDQLAVCRADNSKLVAQLEAAPLAEPAQPTLGGDNNAGRERPIPESPVISSEPTSRGDPAQAGRTDTERLDWLARANIYDRLTAVNRTSPGEEGTPNNLRSSIDAAMSPSAPQEEKP